MPIFAGFLSNNLNFPRVFLFCSPENILHSVFCSLKVYIIHFALDMYILYYVYCAGTTAFIRGSISPLLGRFCFLISVLTRCIVLKRAFPGGVAFQAGRGHIRSVCGCRSLPRKNMIHCDWTGFHHRGAVWPPAFAVNGPCRGSFRPNQEYDSERMQTKCIPHRKSSTMPQRRT